MKTQIPAPIIAVVSELTSKFETHATLDSLFMYAGASGSPLEGISKHAKALEWLRKTNQDSSQPLEVLGKIIELYMEEVVDERHCQANDKIRAKTRLTETLKNTNLQYVIGGRVIGTLATPSTSLEYSIKKRKIKVLNDEFDRALKTVEVSPKDAISSACNILESVCKVYIKEESLSMPAKKDLQPIWSVVRKDLGFDPSQVEDQDLKEILSGLISTVHGIGAIRTHASSAHGMGVKNYSIEPRHARLAVHAAHTVVLFILESWDKKNA